MVQTRTVTELNIAKRRHIGGAKMRQQCTKLAIIPWQIILPAKLSLMACGQILTGSAGQVKAGGF